MYSRNDQNQYVWQKDIILARQTCWSVKVTKERYLNHAAIYLSDFFERGKPLDNTALILLEGNDQNKYERGILLHTFGVNFSKAPNITGEIKLVKSTLPGDNRPLPEWLQEIPNITPKENESFEQLKDRIIILLPSIQGVPITIASQEEKIASAPRLNV